jgi:hypothetical protein
LKYSTGNIHFGGTLDPPRPGLELTSELKALTGGEHITPQHQDPFFCRRNSSLLFSFVSFTTLQFHRDEDLIEFTLAACLRSPDNLPSTTKGMSAPFASLINFCTMMRA